MQVLPVANLSACEFVAKGTRGQHPIAIYFEPVVSDGRDVIGITFVAIGDRASLCWDHLFGALGCTRYYGVSGLLSIWRRVSLSMFRKLLRLFFGNCGGKFSQGNQSFL